MTKKLPSRRPWAALACAVLLLGAGCSRSEQQMEMPDIKLITRENLHSVMALDNDTAWVAGAYGIIYKTTDGGRHWAEQKSGVPADVITDGVFLDKQTGWLAGTNGVILHTTDGGTSWQKQASGTARHLFCLSFVDKDHGWACGDWNTVLHTSDGGASWQKQTDEFDRSLNDIQFLDRHNGWLVGERGIIRRSTDGGATWTKQLPDAFVRADLEEELENPPPTLFGVYFTDLQNGWACGIAGAMVRTTDGGSSWSVLPPVTSNTLYRVLVEYGRGFAVGDKGTFMVSPDSGLSWLCPEEVITSKQPLSDIDFSSPRKGWIVGGGGTAIHTADGGKHWEFFSGLSYTMEFFQMPKALEFDGGTE